MVVDQEKAFGVKALLEADEARAQQLARDLCCCFWSAQQQPECPYLLVGDGHIALAIPDEPRLKPIWVDFADATWCHRRRDLSARREMVARAVGLVRHSGLSVIDATAGLGQDAYVLALLGASVTLLERSPVIGELLADGLRRAVEAGVPGVAQMSLVRGDAHAYLSALREADYPDVIYMDPMYPGREEASARQKKSLRMLRLVVGEDLDADGLFEVARVRAMRRVVVKRPRAAPYLAGVEPDHQLRGSSSRFDVYLV